MKRTFLFISFALYFSADAQEMDTTELLPVEVRAVRAAPTAPFAKTNLSKKEISQQNLGQDLPFILNQTPSVVVNSDAGNGVGYTGIRIRGTDATRINMTLNGIPYNDAESQGLFFVNLPDLASSVNSIQVQRGVGTSTNGPGAFGATINFSTHEVNRTPYAELNNSYGSFNTWKNTLKLGTGILGKHFTTDIRLSRISSDGYVERGSSNLRSFYVSTAYLSEKSDLRFNVFSGKEKTYQAWYGVLEADLKQNRRINYAGTEKPGSPYENETDNYRQDHYQLFFTHRLNPALSFHIATFLTRGLGYYEQYKADEDYADYGMDYPVSNGDTTFTTDLVRQLWLDNYFYGTVFSLQHQVEKRSVTLGGSLTDYNGEHYGKIAWTYKANTSKKNWYDTKGDKKDFNVYGKWQENMTGSLQLFGDVQYRFVQYTLHGFRDHPDLMFDNSYHFFNPKIGFSLRHKNWLGYASFSIANKEPNRDDFETAQEQQPSPEKLLDWEAGIENKKGRSAWSANFYFMKYKDQLVLTGRINDVGAYTRTNIPRSYRLGMELQGSIVFNKWLTAGGNFTWSRNKILRFTEYIDDYDNGGQQEKFYSSTDIAFSPDMVASATISILPVKNLIISAISKYVSDQYLDNTGNAGRKLPAYFTEDLRAVYSLKKGKLKNADFIVQVNNVFNKLYEPNGYSFSYFYNNQLATENYYFPMAGINIMAGLNIRF